MVAKIDKPEPSRKFSYLLQLYEAMEKESAPIGKSKKLRLYEGKVVTTFQTIGISAAYYTELFNVLKELGCIELVDRGVRGRPTKYRLHGKPTEDAYEARYVKGLTTADKPATIPLDELEQRIKNLEGRLSGLQIKEIIVNYEDRIASLESAMKLSKGVAK
jgi:hypothetical protein